MRLERNASFSCSHAVIVQVFASVVRVADSLSVQPSERPPIPPYPRMDKLSLEGEGRRLLPCSECTDFPVSAAGGSHAPPRPPPPQDLSETTDEESEDFFLSAPTPSQGPIMVSSHCIHSSTFVD